MSDPLHEEYYRRALDAAQKLYSDSTDLAWLQNQWDLEREKVRILGGRHENVAACEVLHHRIKTLRQRDTESRE